MSDTLSTVPVEGVGGDLASDVEPAPKQLARPPERQRQPGNFYVPADVGLGGQLAHKRQLLDTAMDSLNGHRSALQVYDNETAVLAAQLERRKLQRVPLADNVNSWVTEVARLTEEINNAV